MGKIHTITPVHIGTGDSYYVACIKDNYIYSLNNVINIMDFNESNREYLYKILQKNKNLSKEEFLAKFRFNKSLLTPDNSMGIVINNLNFLGNTFEMTKNGRNLIIPGSSVKGYISNVLYFDIIQNNNKIKSYLENKFKNIYDENIDQFCKYNEQNREKELMGLVKAINKKVSNIWKDVESDVTAVMNFLCVKDIEGKDLISYYEVERYNINGKKLPQGVYETIPMESDLELQIDILLEQYSNNYIKSRVTSIKEEIESNNRKKKKEELTPIKFALVDEIIMRLSNFKEWFINANRKFMDLIIQAELEYVNNLENINVLKNELVQIYNKLKVTNNNGILIQIGKNTNYMLKSIGIAFTDTYKKLFSLIYSPSANSVKTLKLKPGIQLMGLAKEKEKGVYPLGFIEVEL